MALTISTDTGTDTAKSSATRHHVDGVRAGRATWVIRPHCGRRPQFVAGPEPCQDRCVRTKAGIWGGRTAAERRAERRRRLIEAATDIWSDSGWAAVTMRGVCAKTSLNDRYFYEEFNDRDGLLVAAWDSVRDDMLKEIEAIFAASADQPPLDSVRAAILVVIERIAQDPGRAQILLTHHAGSSPLQERRIAALQQASELVVLAAQPHLKPDIDHTAVRMDTLFAVGGFVELITAWHVGLLDVDAQQIVEHSSRLAATLSDQYLRREPAT